MEDVQRGKQALLDYSGSLFSLISHQDFDIHNIYLHSVSLSIPLSHHLTVYLSIYHLLIILALCSSQKFTLFLCKDWSLTLHLILHIFAPYTQSTNVLRKKNTYTHTQLTEECCLLMSFSSLLSVVVVFSFLNNSCLNNTFSFQKKFVFKFSLLTF